MITYTLWETMRQKGISQYRLTHYFGISSGQLDRIRKNSYISTHTIDVLCNILDCQVQDIIEFHKDAELRAELGAIPNHTPLPDDATPGAIPNHTPLPDDAESGAPADLEQLLNEQES